MHKMTSISIRKTPLLRIDIGKKGALKGVYMIYIDYIFDLLNKYQINYTMRYKLLNEKTFQIKYQNSKLKSFGTKNIHSKTCSTATKLLRTTVPRLFCNNIQRSRGGAKAALQISFLQRRRFVRRFARSRTMTLWTGGRNTSTNFVH